jgi:hypothetical protein
VRGGAEFDAGLELPCQVRTVCILAQNHQRRSKAAALLGRVVQRWLDEVRRDARQPADGFS